MHMPVGSILDCSAVMVGGILGATFGRRIPERIKTGLTAVFGCAAFSIGISMITQVKYLPAIIISLLIGTIFGELFYIERKIQWAATKTKVILDKFLPYKGADSYEVFMERFVALIIIFCASGLGIFGPITEGMGEGSSLLITKAVLDIATAAIFAVSLGYAVALIAIPQFIIQFSLFMLATVIYPITTPEMIADFTATSGVIMLVTGFRITGIKSFAVANMLPALIFIMPISAMWPYLISIIN